ncbi:MAG: ACP S-malonyltransferase [Aphanocapsa sp. GSE-SYN-MK-11-07L]|jgi:[acyl-carrier-protein] S-malonyltransferase|nr:ACP S-malonyltransferase [Aphanocapsa sp. GSE-SYN-MK-11-07L]
MIKTAWVFPGQGSQAIAMGLDLLDTAAGRLKFAQAENILGWSVPQLCQTEAKLSQTLYTQPCLYVVSAILAELMLEQGLSPDLLAGHSLGEYVALYTAGVFDFETGLKLVKRRAELMDHAVEDGKMVALIGFDRSQLQAQVDKIENVVLANDNHAGQVVISGTTAAVDQLLSQIKTKKAIALNVSGAFHSPLMAAAAEEFQKTLESVVFQPARVSVLSNVEPIPATDPEILKERLVQQMTGTVRWRETCLQFLGLGVEQAIEVGPGKVLIGLIKRTCPDMALEKVGNLPELLAATHR